MYLSLRGGFSLPEVLLVMAILSTLAASSFSSQIYQSYQRWHRSNALADDTETLLALIARARSLSISSGEPVYLCGGENCNGKWSSLAFLSDGDASSNAFFSVSFSHDVTIRWQGFPLSRDYIVFLPSGLSSYQNGSFYLCREYTKTKRIVINQSGRAYLDRKEYGENLCS